MNIDDNLDKAAATAYFLIYLKAPPEGMHTFDICKKVKKMLPSCWHDVMMACEKPKVLSVFDVHGVAGAAMVAALHLTPQSQDALADMF